MIFRKLFFLILFLLPEILVAQNRGNVWCFGDSALIDFSSGNPVPGASSLDTRGTCVSISDINSNLLFYGNTRATIGNPSGLIWNKNHQLMMNGDSISGSGWYHEMVIVPNPGDDSSYYVFSIGVTFSIGLLYSIVDLRGDSGYGEVAQKNISLLNNLRMVDCLTAIKHGNGRDWWVIARKSTFGSGIGNNEWYTLLISPSGISSVNTQNVGSFVGTNSGRLCFNSNTNQICFVSLPGLIEMYDFDRCTGIISNPNTIEEVPSIAPFPYNWSCEFSNSGRYLYVSGSTTPSTLWQFDTWAPIIDSTKTLIWQTSYPPFTAGALKKGPDNKIYFSCAWSDSSGNFNYPYPDSAFYTENMNLSVINSPDSAGLACDFQPWSVYLGGKRTYLGLPNNPDYDMPALSGSPCDSLTSIAETPVFSDANLFVYYSSDWQTAFINADNLKGHTYTLEIFDLMGKSIFRESGNLNPPYFTRNLNCSSFRSGVYMVRFVTERERLTRKFIISNK